MVKIAPIYTEADARMILSTVRQMIASGWYSPSESKSIPAIQPAPMVRNDSGEAIPPYSVMQVTGTEEFGGVNYLVVEQFDETKYGSLLVSGDTEIEIEGFGQAQRGPVYRIQGDGSTVTTGHLWGPADAAWTATDNGGPWLVCGEDDVEADVIRVTLDVSCIYSAVVTSEISARSGSVLGTGTVTLQNIGASIVSGQTGIPVQSVFTDAIAVSTECTVGRTTNGLLQLVSVQC